MKTLDHKYLVRCAFPITLGTLILCLLTTSGCTAIGFLLSPGPFEKKTVPEYNLKAQQDRKVMIWIECPYSLGADFDFQEKLGTAFQLTLIQKGGFEPENILLHPVVDSGDSMLDLQSIARSNGAGYVLLVHVDQYAIDSLRIRNYYSGELVIRSVLQDTDLGTRVWPQNPEGKMIEIGVEIENEGREALVNRLTAAAAHCTLRNLFPYDKLKYKHGDERISMQEVYEIETY